MAFDPVSYAMGKKAGGGGGGDITVEPLSVNSNGTYSASGKAYSPVTVSVPNSYSASDEGKVVANGALVAQTSDTVTANDTYDTTLINSLTVNVSGGGSPTITGLSAVYTQSGVVDVHDDLSVLIPDLVVTATISNSLQIEIAPTDYTLSGTLAVGTSTVTVSYAGVTATFSVTVTQYWDYYWDYTDGVKPTGFVEESSGNNGTITLTANGLELYSGDASNGSVKITNTDLNNFTTKATLEVVFSVNKSSTAAGLRCSVTSGTWGVQTNTASNYIRAYTSSTAAGGRSLAYYDTGVDYTLRLLYLKESPSKYSAWVNGVAVVWEDSTSGMQYLSNTQIMSQGNGITGTVKSIRYRKDW